MVAFHLDSSLPAFTFSTTSRHTTTHTISLFNSQHIDSPVFAVAVFIRELRFHQRPIGSEHLISRPARLRAVLYQPYSSSCNNPTAPLRSLFFTNQHTLSVALSSSIYASLDRLLYKDNDNDAVLQQAGHSLTRCSKTSPLQSRQS